VSQAHFDEVQAKLAINRSFARRNNTAHPYLLRALVSCVRIPTKPARHSNLKPATHSDAKPAGVPI
jgi:hypothetical protein